MPPPAPHPRADFLTGALLVAAIVAVAALLVADSVRDRVHGGKRRFFILAPNGRNIKLQAPVVMGGLKVGHVDDIALLAAGEVEVRFHVEPAYGDHVRTNASAALVEPPLGVGLTYIRLHAGTREFPEADDGKVKNLDPEALSAVLERATQRVDPLVQRTKTLLKGVEELQVSADKITYDLVEGDGFLSSVVRDRALQGDLARAASLALTLTADVAAFTGGIDRGEGTLGRLVGKDGAKALKAEIDSLIERARTSIAGIEAAADRLGGAARRVSARLDQVSASLAGAETIYANVLRAGENAAQIAARFAAGRGTIGRIAADPSLMAGFRRFLVDLAETGRDSSEMSPFNMVIGVGARQVPRETPPPTEGVGKAAAK